MRKNKLFEKFGLTLSDVSVTDISQSDVQEIKDLLYMHKVLLIKDQKISKTDYLYFAKKIGMLRKFKLKNYSHTDFPEIMVLNNLSNGTLGSGGKNIGNMWHHDSSYLNEPLALTMLYAVEVTEGVGDTLFINMEDVFSKMSDKEQSFLYKSQAKHEVTWTYKITNDDVGKTLKDFYHELLSNHPHAYHNCIITHPVTGVKSLYMNPGYTTEIKGLKYEENNKKLCEINKQITSKENINRLNWQKDDLLIWDNRSVIHSATALDKSAKRLMYRIGIEDRSFFG